MGFQRMQLGHDIAMIVFLQSSKQYCKLFAIGCDPGDCKTAFFPFELIQNAPHVCLVCSLHLSVLDAWAKGMNESSSPASATHPPSAHARTQTNCAIDSRTSHKPMFYCCFFSRTVTEKMPTTSDCRDKWISNHLSSCLEISLLSTSMLTFTDLALPSCQSCSSSSSSSSLLSSSSLSFGSWMLVWIHCTHSVV